MEKYDDIFSTNWPLHQLCLPTNHENQSHDQKSIMTLFGRICFAKIDSNIGTDSTKKWIFTKNWMKLTQKKTGHFSFSLHVDMIAFQINWEFWEKTQIWKDFYPSQSPIEVATSDGQIPPSDQIRLYNRGWNL